MCEPIFEVLKWSDQYVTKRMMNRLLNFLCGMGNRPQTVLHKIWPDSSNGFYLPATLIHCNIKYIFYDYSALQVKTAVEPYEWWPHFFFGFCLVVGLQHALHFPCKYRIVNARMSVCLFSSYSVPFLQVQRFFLLLASVRKAEEGTRVVVVKIRKESRHIAHHGHTQQHNTRCGIISLRTQVFFCSTCRRRTQKRDGG